MKLWLVRHAQPLLAPGLCYGATDVAADSLATYQAAEALSQVIPHGLPVVSSTLQRCERLAQCLQGLRPDLTYKTDARLVEMNFGEWEGHRWDAIPRAEFERWTDHFGSHRFGGQENLHEFMHRVSGAWDESQGHGQETVWITHAGVIRAATLLSRGVRQVDSALQWPQDAPEFGQWVSVEASVSTRLDAVAAQGFCLVNGGIGPTQ